MYSSDAPTKNSEDDARVGETSVPEPDIAIVAGEPRDFLQVYPCTAVFVVEVAGTSDHVPISAQDLLL